MSSATIKSPGPEIIAVPHDTAEVCCDGGNPALGHPKVYYSFGTADKVVCGYCDREFIRS